MPKYEGSTLETAIENGLKQLNITRNEAEINVIKHPNKGFFGLFKKPAIVEISKKTVTAKPSEQTTSKLDKAATKEAKSAPKTNLIKAKETLSKPKASNSSKSNEMSSEDRFERNFAVVKDLAKYLQAVLEQMGIDATLQVDMPNNKHVYINCETNKEGLLIGRHGRTINSLQQLCEFYLNNHGVNYVEVILDTANYRERRRKILADLTRKTARDVEVTNQPVHLDSMPAFERKQIHAAMEDYEDLITYSVGTEPNREVVIAPR